MFVVIDVITCLCMLGGAVLALLLAGYFAQQYLPPPKPKVIGIDLGEVFNSLSFHFCYFNVSDR